MNEIYVYDKAKYHDESVEDAGLGPEHTYHHTTFFLSWLVKSHLMSQMFEECGQDAVADYRTGKLSINALYEWWDTCLTSDMLSEQGNAFAMSYFDFENGTYMDDYALHLQNQLPSEFHVPYTSANEEQIHRVISQRFEEWKLAI